MLTDFINSFCFCKKLNIVNFGWGRYLWMHFCLFCIQIIISFLWLVHCEFNSSLQLKRCNEMCPTIVHAACYICLLCSKFILFLSSHKDSKQTHFCAAHKAYCGMTITFYSSWLLFSCSLGMCPLLQMSWTNSVLF